MFIFDPSRGARRRALMRDKVVRAARKTRDAAGATGRDLGNRLTGAAARSRSILDDTAVDDHILGERIRAELGRVASHPRSIYVSANGGVVTLTGDVRADEVPTIVARVSRVRGVEDVRNELTSHNAANRVPGLQGKSQRPGWWSTWMRKGWSPSAMLAAGVGTAAIALSLARR
jgi:hypothetical protein